MRYEYWIENYLGFPSGVSGDELASRALQQAKRLGAEILVTRTVAGIDAKRHEIVLDGDELYWVADDGMATCAEARSGQVHWQERLGG